jgi:hypothetical protein
MAVGDVNDDGQLEVAVVLADGTCKVYSVDPSTPASNDQAGAAKKQRLA